MSKAFIALAAFLSLAGIGHVVSIATGAKAWRNADDGYANVPRAPYSPADVERSVKARLRDPMSAVFGPMRAYGDRKLGKAPVTVVCSEVNARNGFGGMTGDKNFVYVMDPHFVSIDGDVGFLETWNKLCAGEHRT